MSVFSNRACGNVLGLLIGFAAAIGFTAARAADNAASVQEKASSVPATIALENGSGKRESVVRIDADCTAATIPFLSWDTEGGDRAKNNLLREAVSLKGRTGATLVPLVGKGEQHGADEVQFRLAARDANAAIDVNIVWTVRIGARGGLTMQFSNGGTTPGSLEQLELLFPFNPRMAATTVLPAQWAADNSYRLPAVLSAPDFGQMLLTVAPADACQGRLRGSRVQHLVDCLITLPAPRPGESVTLTMEPLRLPAPTGMKETALWQSARRGWFNMFQPTAEWGDQGNPFSAPAGILANNVVSDPVSCVIHVMADQALLTPQFSPDIRAPDLVRHTVDWWLEHRTRPTGEVVAYWDYVDMLDANTGVIIGAWDYVEAAGDCDWLARRIERLELVADYLIRRDIDDDGLIESTHSGNYGTLKNPMRADSAYDTINAGHKNAYCNALAYRAFRCLADLERQANRGQQQSRYSNRADRLKAVYATTFFNPTTGWLAWWRSEDGELHDLASPMISSLAICYGLIDPAQGRDILRRFWEKMEAVGFRRFDLGVPITLVPVRRGDYLIGDGICGAPQREDGSDTFGQYLNGGCLVMDATHFMTALYTVGENEKGDQILHAMLERQEKGVFPNGGGFQNGVIDAYPQGAEFYTWDGTTCGYEGHLVYSFSFLQAVLLREPAFRARLFRPMQ